MWFPIVCASLYLISVAANVIAYWSFNGVRRAQDVKDTTQYFLSPASEFGFFEAHLALIGLVLVVTAFAVRRGVKCLEFCKDRCNKTHCLSIVTFLKTSKKPAWRSLAGCWC